MSGLDPEAIIEILELEPLRDEGGMFRQVWATEHGTAIWFLLRPGDFSALHRLDRPEIWHHYAGAPVDLVLLHPDGSSESLVLGPDLADGALPMRIVDAEIWMGADTTGDWSLLGTTMAPPFDLAGFVLGERAPLIEAYPARRADIIRLTRE